ncbi:MAG: hypothetical protein IPP77_05725 [Bacteroidetes bacterium]|nr:hypothetical protein [Bacteroidota bacterium]
MSKAILKMYGKTATVVIALFRACIAAMTGNINFSVPLPSLADWTLATDAWEAAETLVTTLKHQLSMAVADSKLKKKAAMDIGVKVTAYVQNVSGGDPAIIESANMFIQDFNAPDVTSPPQAQNLSLTHNDLFGHIDAHWDAVHHFGHIWYNMRYTFNDPFGTDPIVWVPFDHDVSSTAIDLSNPAHAGQRVWVQVRAVNSAGAGPWSAANSIIIALGATS